MHPMSECIYKRIYEVGKAQKGSVVGASGYILTACSSVSFKAQSTMIR